MATVLAFSTIIRRTMPDTAWVLLYGFITLILSGISNISIFMSRLGIVDSSTYFFQQLDSNIQLYAGYLNSFQQAGSVITFLAWSIVGLLSFAVLQIIVRATTELYQEELFLTRYIHPMSYSPSKYLAHRLLSILELVAIILLVILSFMLTFLLCLTSLIKSSRAFTLDTSNLTAAAIAVGWFIAFWLGLCLVHASLNLMAHRHSLLND